jgi:glycosyltransferase involved in cell wall biosynthesis
MRILHVIPFLWSGAGSVVTRLCESQARRNEVAIVTAGASKGFTDWPAYRKRLRTAGVRHDRIDFFDREPAVFWPGVRKFLRLLEQFRPDVVHCHSGVPALAAAVAGIRFIAQIHSWGVGRPDWMNLMDLEGFRRAAVTVCGSRAYERILLEGGVDAARVRYLPWGLDLREIQGGSSGRTTGSRFEIGFLGRIEPRKGQLDLAKAFHRFRRHHPESVLNLVGPVADKTYAEELRVFVRKAGLQHSVRLTGRVDNPYPELSRWNLFTSLSSDEGQGLAILEAMALGVPVLARKAAGVEDYLRDGRTGLALESSSARETADRIAWAFHHPKEVQCIAVRAKKMVESQYDWNSTLERMNRTYAAFTGSNQRLGQNAGRPVAVRGRAE